MVLRVLYPMSFYAKRLDGRIDDPNAGWKGRGVWTTSGDRAPWLKEGGKGTVPIAFHFQFRPNPLADDDAIRRAHQQSRKRQKKAVPRPDGNEKPESPLSFRCEGPRQCLGSAQALRDLHALLDKI